MGKERVHGLYLSRSRGAWQGKGLLFKTFKTFPKKLTGYTQRFAQTHYNHSESQLILGLTMNLLGKTILLSVLLLTSANALAKSRGQVQRERVQRLAQIRDFQAQELDFVDKVVVDKSERKLYLMATNSEGELQAYRTYSIMLGWAPSGHKTEEGDGKTPEGTYTIDYRNPKSRYFLSLHINYPNAQDIAQAKERGVSPGGEIFIHGMPNELGPYYSAWIPDWMDGISRDLVYSALEFVDWTQGCIAVSNEAIQEIYDLVKDGTPIELNP